ncbi:MAG: hypothetical protein WC047_08450 [Kiritimatiellales bacterium]
MQAKTVLFRNFSDQVFSAVKPHEAQVGDQKRMIIDENCKWDGEPYTFEAGEARYMADWKARHFAKHLVNRELVKKGMDSDTSPKKPEDNPRYMELFNKAYIEDSGAEAMSESRVEDEIVNKNKDLEIANLKAENAKLRGETGEASSEVEDKNERGATAEEVERQAPAKKEEKSELVTPIEDDEDEEDAPAGSEEAEFVGLKVKE